MDSYTELIVIRHRCCAIKCTGAGILAERWISRVTLKVITSKDPVNVVGERASKPSGNRNAALIFMNWPDTGQTVLMPTG